ncbi:CRISPR-associated endonuclease/helicase Cas3 [compost metagenome]
MVTRFSELDARARVIWAKSGEPFGHGLLAHLLDVAAVAETLLEHEPGSTRAWVAGAFGLPVEAAARWTAALVGLHDFGKAIPGFQAKWSAGQVADEAAGLVFTARSQGVTDHACASAALLSEHLPSLGLGHLPWILPVLQAVSAHHGYNFHQGEIGNARPRHEAPEWGVARRQVFEAYWSVLSPAAMPTAAELSLPAVEWLAGLTSVADWIGSNPDWFPLGERCDVLADHFADAKARAARALADIGWSTSRPLLDRTEGTDRLIARIVQREAVRARPLQVEGDRLLAEAQGPALLLVEAPMGEGKTELAFLAHLRLQAANQHRGLYVALPTQATGNALFERTLSFLQAFAGEGQLDVQLVHGGALLNERVLHLRGIHGAPGESVSSSAWFSQRRRPLLSPYGVGTIDQALFAGLNVKHHFVRLWGLGNRVVVFDEVHAYDHYTLGLIEALLRWLKALGSSVVLMSATLPEQRRNALLQAWGVSPDAAPELPYPRLLLADERGVKGATFPSRPLSPISLLAIDEQLQCIAACVLAQLEHGGYGAVIVNTVDRAQQLYRLLQPQMDGDVRLLLFHARFPADQRRAREQTVLEVFGPGGTDSQRPGRALLVATQVVEQSLDLDFDFLVTDLAPVDLLLQRAGRLHRHQRPRVAAHAEARLFVAGLRPDRLPDMTGTAWKFIYSPYILGRTWALLSREATLYLPQDIDRLVQAVYRDDEPLPAETQESVRTFIEGEAYGAYLGDRNTEKMMARNVAIDALAEPQNAYQSKLRGYEAGEEGLGLPNHTRLGDKSLGLVPLHEVPGGWSLEPAGESFAADQRLQDHLAKALYSRQINLSRTAVVKHFQGMVVPRSFSEHPLLRHLMPLLLTDGSLRIGTLVLRLDAELGVVYEKEEGGELPP